MAKKNNETQEMSNILTSTVEVIPSPQSQLELYQRIETIKREINNLENKKQTLQNIYDEFAKYLNVKANIPTYINKINE